MSSITKHSYIPEVCSTCASRYGITPKPVFAHRYGDYVVLKPDAASSKKLHQLAKEAGDLVSSELGTSDVDVYDPERMHLTLAMPLKPLSKGEAGELIKKIKRAGADTPISFDLIFKGKDHGGSQGFSFGTATFAPGFLVQLREPSKPVNGHDATSAHRKMSSIASNIQKFCEGKGLVSLKKNPDGKCNPFKPHISLGSVGSEHSKTLHSRVAHKNSHQSALSHLLNVEVSKTFRCDKHKDCPRLPLKFDKVEILRVDALDDHSHATHRLASLDLKTGKAQISEKFPSCSHEPRGPSFEDVMSEMSSSSETSEFSIPTPAYEPERAPEISSLANEALAPAFEGLTIEDFSPAARSTAVEEISGAVYAVGFSGDGFKFDPMTFGLGADHKGVPMIQARFSDKNDAEFFLSQVAPEQKNAKIHNIGGNFVVNLGPNRLKNMFGASKGTELYTKAVSEMGGDTKLASKASGVASKKGATKLTKKDKKALKKEKKTTKKEKKTKKTTKKQKKAKKTKSSKKASKEVRSAALREKREARRAVRATRIR